MTRTVIPRPRAELDVDDFFFYLALECDSESAANRFLDELSAAYDRLVQHPEIGVLQDFKHPELARLRMWPVPRFEDRLIYYIVYDNLIDVVRILGAPQDREETLLKE